MSGTRNKRVNVSAIEPLALTGHFQWPTEPGAASATPTAALSGQHLKAPGFAGGYLLARSDRIPISANERRGPARGPMKRFVGLAPLSV
jgi:hypothetical protein